MKPCRKKVYFINDMPYSLGFGGKEIQLEKYRNFLKDTHEVVLLDPWERIPFEKDAIFHLFGCGKYFDNLIGQIRQKIANPKIVISPTIYYENTRLFKIANKISKIIPMATQFDFKQNIFDNVDVLIPNSYSEKNFIISVWGEHLSKKTFVIYNSIDVERFSKETHFSPCDLGVQKPYILNISFQDERKNTLGLLKAFKNTMHLHDLQLVMVGGSRFIDVANKQRFDQLLEDIGDRVHRIEFLPPNSIELISLLQNCEFHVLPSNVETPGLATLEALASNKPCLVGMCEPTVEYFKDQVIYCVSKSINSIEEGIMRLVHGVNATSRQYDFVEKNYSDVLAKEFLLRVYQDL